MAQISAKRRVAVIGGGITGLAAAHRLRELDPAIEVTLFEASDRLGGVLQTEHRDGYLLEMAADNFITSVPWAKDLCRRIGLADELLPTNEANRRALVVREGRLHPVPEGFLLMQPTAAWPVLRSPLLSLRGKLRLLGEYFVPARADQSDESLASFARRRLGREAFERLVQPLASGIYTADAEKLSLLATLPRFLEMERRHGGLIKAALRERGTAAVEDAGARYSMFVAPREGVASLVAALAARLPAGTVRLNTPVTAIAPQADGKWQVQIGESKLPSLSREGPGEGRGQQRDEDKATNSFDTVIIATPAPRTACLVDGFANDLAGELRSIPYAGTAIALVGLAREQVARPLDGFGFVVPEIEKRPILSVSYASVKYPGRAPDGYVLLRVFLGGASRPELVEESDDRLRAIVVDELRELLGVRGEPHLFQIAHWPHTMPQYHLGHLERLERIESSVAHWPGLQLAGNAYHGVGIPHCIHSSELAAEGVIAALAQGFLPPNVQCRTNAE